MTPEPLPSAGIIFIGSVAGFVVGLAYLIPQWVGAPGVLDSNVTAVTPTIIGKSTKYMLRD
ncbi:MAG: hypothetical protein JO076_15835 [Verrucomicrobia bacterium]|nr:hypothetical protein [Verrucomicrobiota bacterium]